MIRLIRIGDQIMDGRDDFAFWDTVVDKFVELYDTTVFSSVEDLIEADRLHGEQPSAPPRHDIERLVRHARSAKCPEKDPLDE